MRVSLFGGVERSWSIERYARELSGAFPEGVTVETIVSTKPRGLVGKFTKYFRYPAKAKKHEGDCNIVLSESNGYLLLALDPARTLVVCHDVHPLYFAIGDATYRLRFQLNLRLMARARFVIAVSESTKQDLLQLCPFIPEHKIAVIHNGLARQWFTVRPPEELSEFRHHHKLGQKRIVLHVGNDMPHKNVSSLLQALAEIQDPNWVFAKVGEISHANRKLIAELNLTSRVFHFDGTSDDDLRRFYQVADVLVFPSLREGFGWPPLEAMACGCPVIASTTGSIPEVCQGACVYVDPTDVSGMTNAIRQVANDCALRADLIEKGRQRAARFNWETTALKMVRLMDISKA